MPSTSPRRSSIVTSRTARVGRCPAYSTLTCSARRTTSWPAEDPLPWTRGAPLIGPPRSLPGRRAPPARSCLAHQRVAALGLGRAVDPQAWVEQLVQAEVDQREPHAEQRDARTGRDEPPPGADREGLVVVGDGAHVPPGEQRWVAQPDEREDGLGKDREDHAEDKVGHDDRQLVGQDLDEHDPPGPLPR